MSKPNEEIDEAKVLYWAWSGSISFGFVGDPKDPMASKIYGLAICQYENSNDFYRFTVIKIGKRSKIRFMIR